MNSTGHIGQSSVPEQAGFENSILLSGPESGVESTGTDEAGHNRIRYTIAKQAVFMGMAGQDGPAESA